MPLKAQLEEVAKGLAAILKGLDVGAIFHSSPSLDMRRIWLAGDYSK